MWDVGVVLVASAASLGDWWVGRSGGRWSMCVSTEGFHAFALEDVELVGVQLLCAAGSFFSGGCGYCAGWFQGICPVAGR